MNRKQQRQVDEAVAGYAYEGLRIGEQLQKLKGLIS